MGGGISNTLIAGALDKLDIISAVGQVNEKDENSSFVV